MCGFRVVLVVLATMSVVFAGDNVERRVAITFDDLPIAGSVAKDGHTRRKMTIELLASLTEREIPAIGFVNERQLYSNGNLEADQVDFLRLWIDGGFELGNHSYSHPDLHRVSLDAFKADIIRGEQVIRPLLAERNQKLEYFRHPFLHTGRDMMTKSGVEGFLSKNDYSVAPVSIDNSEWIFARAYDLAVHAENYSLAEQIGVEYIEYMLEVFVFYKDQSKKLFDRNISHILLLHANELNSTWFGVLADRLLARGYEFISITEALRDPAYQSADTYTGPAGITWLHRWAMTRKVDPAMFRGEPETPAHILKLAELR